MGITLVLLLLNVLLVSSFPAVVEEEVEEVTNNEDAAVTEAPEEKEDSGAGDLVNRGASARHGLLGLLGAKIDLIKSLLTNKGLHEHVGKTVEFGVNVTKGLVGAK